MSRLWLNLFARLSLSALLLPLSALSAALPNTLQARGGVTGPSAAYQIYSDQPDRSTNLANSNSTSGGNQTTAFARRALAARGVPFQFHVSQGPGGTDQQDLVVSFANLPCPPASHGAYSFEFNYVPGASYTTSGQNQIYMYKINGAIPAAPTFNNVDAITGSMIGTFELPTGADANSPRLIFLNQLVCEPTINLRFGITADSNEAGSVAYLQRDGMGLRERDGF